MLSVITSDLIFEHPLRAWLPSSFTRNCVLPSCATLGIWRSAMSLLTRRRSSAVPFSVSTSNTKLPSVIVFINASAANTVENRREIEINSFSWCKVTQ